MAKERESRKKEKKEKKKKKEKKMREAEVLEVKEKKISKKHKSESKKPEKTEKSKKKSKKSDVKEKSHKKSDESDIEERSHEKSDESDVEKKSHKKSKESKRKHKTSYEPEEAETQIARSDVSHPVTVPIVTTNESESDFEYDKEDIKKLLGSYTKEELINLIYKTTEKGSRLISAVLESADRDSAQRNIFVRGLGWDTTHENLKTAFEVYGEIEECSVVMDKDTGRAKGYGFVMFKTRKGAREALRNPEKRMYNRTVSCNLAAAKPPGAGKLRDAVESVKIDLTQNEVPLPVLDLPRGHGFDKGHQQQAMPMYAGQNMPFYQHPGFNPMYGPLMGNQMIGGLPNYHMFGSGLMNQMPPNHVGMTGQYVGDGNGNGVGAGFDGDRGWYLR